MPAVRISVACLVPTIGSPSNKPSYVGFLNLESLKKGKPIFTALGGAIKLTPLGMEILRRQFGVSNFLKEDDARFLVDESAIDDVIEFFKRRDSAFYETEPARELIEELVGIELPGQSKSFLTMEDMRQFQTVFVRSVRQKPGISEPSAREIEIQTHRLFFIFRGEMPDSVRAKFANSEFFKFFTPEELAKGYAADGSKLGGNFVQ